jgi:hypothetical protein
MPNPAIALVSKIKENSVTLRITLHRILRGIWHKGDPLEQRVTTSRRFSMAYELSPAHSQSRMRELSKLVI